MDWKLRIRGKVRMAGGWLLISWRLSDGGIEVDVLVKLRL